MPEKANTPGNRAPTAAVSRIAGVPRRRALLQTAGVAVAAMVGRGLLGAGRGEAAVNPVNMGVTNDAGASATEITSSTDQWSFLGTNTSTGNGLEGQSNGGIGVYGYSDPGGKGVLAESPTGTGLYATSGSGTAVFATTNTGVAVDANAAGNHTAVSAKSDSGTGLHAESNTGAAVYAKTSTTANEGAAILATNMSSYGTAVRATGSAYGVWAEGTQYSGIHAVGNTGVEGVSLRPDGIGVSGIGAAPGAWGVVANVPDDSGGVALVAGYGDDNNERPTRLGAWIYANGGLAIAVEARGGTGVDAVSGDYDTSEVPLTGVGVRGRGTRVGVLAQGSTGATAIRAEAPAKGRALVAVGTSLVRGSLKVVGPTQVAGALSLKSAGLATLNAGRKAMNVRVPASITLGAGTAIFVTPQGDPTGRTFHVRQLTAHSFQVVASAAHSASLALAWLVIN